VCNADLRAWRAETARPYYGHGFDAPSSGTVISLSTTGVQSQLSCRQISEAKSAQWDCVRHQKSIREAGAWGILRILRVTLPD
jgi:hypothetical protein